MNFILRSNNVVIHKSFGDAGLQSRRGQRLYTPHL